MNKKIVTFLVPVFVVFLCSFLALSSMDKKIGDLFQRSLKNTVEDSTVLIINVDDATVEQVGTYPLGRDVYAKSLVALKDLDAGQVVFDISFLDKGLARIDERYITEDLSDFIERNFRQLEYGYTDLDSAMQNILVSVSHILDNSDTILANSLKFFDESYLTLTFGTGFEPSEETNDFLKNSVAIKNIQSLGDTKTPDENTLNPAYGDFLVNAKRAGSVNANPDSDGYLRRIHLFRKYNGEYYGTLALVPILQRLGNPDIKISNSKIIFENADLGNGIRKNIVIPRAEDGSLLLKYPNKQYAQYNQISLWNIYRLALKENEILSFVQQMSENGFFTLWENEDPADYMNAFLYFREELYNGENEDEGITYEEYRNYKDYFWTLLKTYLSDETKTNIMMDPYLDDESKQYISETFDIISEQVAKYEQDCNEVREKVQYATGIVGVTATSSTDSGLNQYEDKYPNVGAHYILANQILSQDFVDDSPVWISILIALILCLAYSFVSSKIKGTGRQIVLGISAIVGTIVILLLEFILTRKFIGAIVPVTSISITFVTTTILGFIAASKDKKFITNAFGQCLSPEVVKEIVANPSSFKLGGQNLEMTAIFTDIQKFSSFSELLSAGQLVALLNFYLTKMSDIIMEERGTVDKYEGDAIIALVGAPVKMEDHAIRAVTAALKMKAEEKIMNQEILKIAAAEKPEDMDDELYSALKIMVANNKTIFTRIGLNSGEMIAGYMGSENKKNYTMMGNNVNLASRLEGVNKQYSTGGILISEATRKLLGDEILVRRLDKVRVVNVNTPIQLYEPMMEMSKADETLKKYVADWEIAMTSFESGNYEKALSDFEALSKSNAEDKVAVYYIKLIRDFFIKGTYPKEADNFGVEYMPEDKVFKLLQK